MDAVVRVGQLNAIQNRDMTRSNTMRISPKLFAVVICAAAVPAAYAQAGNSDASRVANRATSIPSGVSFTYDNQRGQITATGLQLTSSTPKSDGPAPVTGTIDVTIQIKVASKFEGGTTYHCSVYAIGGILNLNTGTVEGGVENANTFGTRNSKGVVTCSFSIPYEWTLSSGSGDESGLILAYAAAAVNPHSEVEHSTLQVDGILNLPANETTSKFTYNVTL
jgi:hypothetical protein